MVVSNADPFWANRKRSFTLPNEAELQAELFAQMLDAYLAVGGDFTIAGTSDKYSWFNYPSAGHPEVKAMIFDDNNQPKPAYYALRDVLKRRLGL